MIFSSEFDGMAHVLWEWALEKQREELKQRLLGFKPKTIAMEQTQKIEQKFAEFIHTATSSKTPDWDTPISHNPLFGVDFSEISVPIIRALTGIEAMQITASYPNRGAVQDFSDKTVLEYTITLDGNNIIPADNLYIPSPFKGLITSLAEHQTWLGDAIA